MLWANGTLDSVTSSTPRHIEDSTPSEDFTPEQSIITTTRELLEAAAIMTLELTTLWIQRHVVIIQQTSSQTSH